VQGFTIGRRHEGAGERVFHLAHHVVGLVLDGLHRLAHLRGGAVLERAERLGGLVAEPSQLFEHVVPVVFARQEEADQVLKGHGPIEHWERAGLVTVV